MLLANNSVFEDPFDELISNKEEIDDSKVVKEASFTESEEIKEVKPIIVSNAPSFIESNDFQLKQSLTQIAEEESQLENSHSSESSSRKKV